MKWDIHHYTDDISRLESEIDETTLFLDNYRKQLTGLMEYVSVLITDMPDILKKLQQELVERWGKWDIERRDRIQSDYRELDYNEFSRKYIHADVMFKSKTDEPIYNL